MQFKLLLISVMLTAGLLAGTMAAANDEVTQATLLNAGIPDTTAADIRACLEEADRQGLPPASLRLRLREGLVKRVPPGQLLEALQRHARALNQARQLQQKSIEISETQQSMEGLDLLARALESGLPPEALAEALADSQGRMSQRIQAIIEAGEMLHLAGVDAEGVKAFIGDCREHDLPRMATMRAARFWIQAHRDGQTTPEIRQSLWKSTDRRERHHERGRRGGPRHTRGSRRSRHRAKYSGNPAPPTLWSRPQAVR
ncbi:MAG: hypothetical protein ABR497_05330 [Kiritimatiellia bacterium]